MQYIQSTLLSDEKCAYATAPHWIVFSSAAVAFLVFCLVFMNVIPVPHDFSLYGYRISTLLTFAVFMIAVYFFLQNLIVYKTSEYGVTNKRVLMKTGWIQRASLEVFLNRIEAIIVDQSVVGRIFNYGQIIIVGTGGSRDSFPYIPRPLHFRQMVQQQIDISGKSQS
jgi:uncharacterized membrane protein YdbT with pleckstrin-like domain